MKNTNIIHSLLKELKRKRITKKRGIMEMIFRDGRKSMVRIHDNMDVGYNLALCDIVKWIEKNEDRFINEE